MIHFPCDSCHYEVSAPDDEVGNFMLCPSCFARLRIPPPKTNEKIEDALASNQIYGMSTGDSKEAEKYKKMIQIHCRVCNTLMYAARERIGEHMICPDCGTKTLVCRRVAADKNLEFEDRRKE
jgi:formylmethanofuran dehydrogenase subunit E